MERRITTLFSALCIILPVTVSCVADQTTSQLATPKRVVQAQVAGEMPDYTIARAYSQLQASYPFIEPIAPAASGNFIAHKNLVYDRIAEREMHLDLYQPTTEAGLRPVVLLVHGGGWRSGDRSHWVPMAQALAEAGFVGVTVEYRLSREALYPAGQNDLLSAIRWLREHSETFSIDPNKIAILGASAGAHMATLAGVSGHTDTLTSQKKLDDSGSFSSRVQAIINVDGVVEITSPEVRSFEDKPGKISYMALWLGGRYHELPALWHEASPLAYVSAATPPTLFINSAQPRFHAGRDPYVAELARHNTYYEIHTLPDSPHSFWLFHPWYDTTRDILIAFLKRVFLGDRPLAQSAIEPLSLQRIEQQQTEQRAD